MKTLKRNGSRVKGVAEADDVLQRCVRHAECGVRHTSDTELHTNTQRFAVGTLKRNDSRAEGVAEAGDVSRR